MWVRLFWGIALLAVGFYVGREIGRHEPVVEELRRARAIRDRFRPALPDGSGHSTGDA